MADDDVVWVPILPSLRGFANSLRSGTERAAQDAGEAAGDALARGIESRRAAVEKATDRVAKAQDKVADAAGKVRAEEAKLEEARNSGRATQAQIVALTERVEAARRREAQASKDAERAARGLTSATEQLARAQQESEDAVSASPGGLRRMGDVAGDTAGKLKGLAVAAAGVGAAVAGGINAAMEREAGNDLLAAQLGASPALAKEYGETAGRIYAGAWGDSMEHVNEAVGAVASTFVTAGFEGEASLEKITTNALDFAKVFGVDVNDAVMSAHQLVTNGLAKDSTEAFDLMTAAFQRVPAAMRDELPDIMGEYGTFFRGLGFDGEEAMGMLVAASRNGAIELDKTGDALKEFTLLGSDMSESSVGAYEKIKLNAEEMSRAVASGGAPARDALQQVATGLLDIEDPLERANTAIALFGTPLGDLTVDQIPAFLDAIANGTGEMVGFEGAMAEMSETVNDNALTGIQSWARGMETGFVDMIGEDVMPILGEFTAGLEENEGSMLATVAGMTGFGGALAGFEQAQGVFGSVKDGLSSLKETAVSAKETVQAGWENTKAAASWVKTTATAGLEAGKTAAAWVGAQAKIAAGWVATAAKATASFIGKAASATAHAAVVAASWLGAQAKIVGGWIMTGAQAAASAAATAASWLAAQAKVAAAWALNAAKATASFVATAASATLNAGIVAAQWVAANARAAASFVATRVAMLAGAAATGAVTAAQWLLNAALNANPIGLVIAALAALAAGLYMAWEHSETFRAIVTAAWEGIQAAASFAWEHVIRPVFDNFVNGLRVLGDAGMWLWHNAIQPAFDGIGNAASWVWNNVVSPVFESMKTGVGLVGSAFDAAAGFIGQMWDRVRGLVAAPIKFVIDSVYNRGIVPAWGKVSGWLGLPGLEEYKPEWLGQYAGGGVLPGYSPDRDNLRFVSTDGSAAIDLGGGESILRPEVAKAVGPEWVHGVNAAARKGTGAVRQYLGGFAGGGIVESIISIAAERFPGLSVSSSYRNSNDLHGQGKAVDLSNQYAGGPSTPLMQEAARYFYEEHGPNLAELIHWPLNGWQNIDEGKPFNFGEPTNSQHTDHLHVASHSPLEGGGGGFGDWAKGIWNAATGWLRERVASAFDAIMDPIGNMIPSFGDSPIGQLPKKAFDTIRGSVRDWLLGKADETEGAGTGVEGSGPVRDQVREAMAAYGWDTGEQWDAVDWIVTRESGWDPNAVNASSGAWGLFQFNPSSGTLQEYIPDRNPNPRVQGEAGARYIRDRYGDPLAARRFWEANGHYDSGGLAVGKGLMLKDIIQPERVLDPENTKSFDALVPHLVELADGFASGGLEGLPGGTEFVSFLAQLPGQILEEQAGDVLDFFGLGQLTDVLFADPATSTDAGLGTVDGPAEAADGEGGDAAPAPAGPLVVIENMIVDDVREAAEAMGREARRLVRSDIMVGGWG